VLAERLGRMEARRDAQAADVGCSWVAVSARWDSLVISWTGRLSSSGPFLKYLRIHPGGHHTAKPNAPHRSRSSYVWWYAYR